MRADGCDTFRNMELSGSQRTEALQEWTRSEEREELAALHRLRIDSEAPDGPELPPGYFDRLRKAYEGANARRMNLGLEPFKVPGFRW